MFRSIQLYKYILERRRYRLSNASNETSPFNDSNRIL